MATPALFLYSSSRSGKTSTFPLSSPPIRKLLSFSGRARRKMQLEVSTGLTEAGMGCGAAVLPGTSSSFAPQFTQNLEPAGISWPH